MFRERSAPFSRLTIAMVYAGEPLYQLRRCYDSQVAQAELLQKYFNQIDWLLICAPSSDLSTLEFFKGEIVSSKKNHIGENRNLAMDYASDGWIYFTDPDCWGEPLALLKLVEAASKNILDHTVGFAGANRMITTLTSLNDFFIFLNNCQWLNGRVPQLAQSMDFKKVQHAPTCHILYSPLVVKNFRFSKNIVRVGEDLDFNWRVCKNDLRILIVPDSVVNHEQAPSLFKFFLKTFFYGFAQTQLLWRYPKSFVNPRLIVLWAIITLTFTMMTSPYLFQLFLLMAVIILATLTIYESKNHGRLLKIILNYVFYLTTLFCYGLGQIFGLVRPPKDDNHAEPIRANI